MSGGLREYWGLPTKEHNANGNGEFGQDFRAGLTDVNQDLQVVAVRGDQAEHQKLEANRQNLIKAYQATSGLGDSAKNDQVMGAVAKVKLQTSAKATSLSAGYEEWQKRADAFDAAVVKIGELEDAGHPEAPAYRQVSNAIQNRVDNHDFGQAKAAFDQLQTKLEQADVQNSSPNADSSPLPRDTLTASPLGTFVDREAENLVKRRSVPSPGDAAKKIEDRKQANQPTSADDGQLQSTKFGRSRKAVDDFDGRLSADVEYDKLPTQLKEKLSQQFWGGLGTKQRRTLVETFRRMHSYGVWDEVVKVTGEMEKPQPHFRILNWDFEVDGNSGGLLYVASNGKQLIDKLIKTGYFGQDSQLLAREHPGKISLREWRNDEPNTPTSLHISVAPDSTFDAHIDKVSPVSKPDAGGTRIDPVRGPEHRIREVEGGKINEKNKVPITFKPTVQENRDGKQEGFVNVLEVRGPVRKDKNVNTPKPDAPNPADPKLQEDIIKRVERTKNYFPISIGTRPAEVPEAKAVATLMSAKMLDSARTKQNTIAMDLNYYKDKTEDHPRALAMMREIGQIVRELLGSSVEGVKFLQVTFGSPKQGGKLQLAN